MASTNDVIFPESMADILTNTVDICFGSMTATSTAPVACLVIEGNAVTTNQQIGTNLSSETHPPTHSYRPDRRDSSCREHALRHDQNL
jgi:hypothetical protein